MLQNRKSLPKTVDYMDLVAHVGRSVGVVVDHVGPGGVWNNLGIKENFAIYEK